MPGEKSHRGRGIRRQQEHSGAPPRIDAATPGSVTLLGEWSLRGLAGRLRGLRRELTQAARSGDREWDLRGVASLDLTGAIVLWRAWDQTMPSRLQLLPEQETLLARVEAAQPHPLAAPRRPRRSMLSRATDTVRGWLDHLREGLALLGQLALDLGALCANPRQIPWRELSATVYSSGARALNVTALVGTLVGVVVSYLSALQLRLLGASSFIVDILGLAIIRELGPMLAAILVAGRSGSSMTAEIGVMRVTQELDAMAALGISQTIRLVVPKLLGLVVVLPLLVIWTDVTALIGGMVSARQTLDISYSQFVARLPAAVPAVNYFIGLLKAVVFGGIIAVTACHFGIRIRPNTESLSTETTNSVVAAITQVILLDAVFAVLFQGVGWS